jgi:drug/metabolite transporter (DMT)-like permease
LLVGAQGNVGARFRPLRSRQLIPIVVLAAFLGTYLGIWLQQVSFKYTAAGIAQALLATSPLFVLPIAIGLGDRVTWRAVLGVLMAIGGIWLLISGT